MAAEHQSERDPGFGEGPGSLVPLDREPEYGFFDFDEDAAIESAERRYEQWLGRT